MRASACQRTHAGGGYSIFQRRVQSRPAVCSRAAVHGAPDTSQQVKLTGSCYEDVVSQLAERALQAASTQPPGRRLLVGIAGAPGSGKSTLAALACRRINERAAQDSRQQQSAANSGPQQARHGSSQQQGQDSSQQQGQDSRQQQAGQGSSQQQAEQGQQQGQQQAQEVCALLPMDGFHLYKRQLDAMPDPKEAYARRGAPWTFDADAFVSCVRAARDTPHVAVPSFDHGVGDPVEGGLAILPHHRIVLVEGNYVLLGSQPWDELKRLFDDTWFVDVDLDVAMQRVFARQTGLGLAPEVSKGRISGNDRPNGELVNACKRHAAVLVPSSLPLKGNS